VRLCEELQTGQEVEVDMEADVLTVLATGQKYPLKPIGDVSGALCACHVRAATRTAACIADLGRTAQCVLAADGALQAWLAGKEQARLLPQE
jgi:hypothetical protein